MDTGMATVLVQLALLAATVIAAVFAASSARRAASFDLTRDFDALAAAVAKLQNLARSQQMSRVRQAGLTPKDETPTPSPLRPMTHDEIRALLRAKAGHA